MNDHTDPDFVTGAVLAQLEDLDRDDQFRVLADALRVVTDTPTPLPIHQKVTPNMNPTIDDAHRALHEFVLAAARLCDVWTTADFAAQREGTTSPIDEILTATYPAHAIPMSFDEWVAEVDAWQERVLAHDEVTP